MTLLPKRCALLLVVLLIPTAARGDAVFYESLEWMVADSEVVVRGAVAKVEEKTGKGWNAVTIQVAETFKGTPKAEVVFADRVGLAKSWQALIDEKAEVLVFLVPTTRYPVFVREHGP